MIAEPKTARGTAQFIKRLGGEPVLLARGEKRPVLKGWQTHRYTDEDIPKTFNGVTQNVGMRLDNNLTIGDAEWPDAEYLFNLWLPPTGLVGGRTSRPRSHPVYYCPDAECKKYIDPTVEAKSNGSGEDAKRALILELITGSAHQVVVFGGHPSNPAKERYGWATLGEPATVSREELERAAGKAAAGALLAKHWGGQGERHHLTLPLVGGLIRAGWDEEQVWEFLEPVLHLAGDTDLADRRRVIEDTARRLGEGEVLVTGIPELKKLLDPRIVDCVFDWLGLSGRTGTWPKPLGSAAYHGIVGRFVEATAPQTEADPAALLLTLLTFLGNMIGRSPHIIMEADRHGTNLFTALVGTSSKGRKGVSRGRIQEPLKQIDEYWASNCVQSGLSSGEGLIHAVRDPIFKVKSPKKSRANNKKRVGDTTDEAPAVTTSAPTPLDTPIDNFVTELEMVDEGVSDKRLLAVQSEFSSVLKVLAREGNTLSTVMREAWDNTTNLAILTRNNPAKATEPHISMLAHTTDVDLRRYLDDTEAGNGYANRYLWALTRRANILPMGGGTPENLGAILRTLAGVVSKAKAIGRVEWGDDASKLWHEVYPKLSAAQPGLIGSVTARAEAQVLRLSLLYAVLDGSELIRLPHLRAALEVWRYCAESARHIFGSRLGDKYADRILQALRSEPAGLTKTELTHLFGGSVSAERLDQALELLTQYNRVYMEKRPTGGRPEERWFAK